MENLQEASVGNIDRLYGEIDKVKTSIVKAQNSLLDVADELTNLILFSNQIGGKVSQIVPSYLKPHIALMTKLAQTDLQEISEGQTQSSLSNLKELLGSIPYRDLKPQDTQDVRNSISLQPNLANGPQTAIKENLSVEEFYANATQEFSKLKENDNCFSFENLKREENIGSDYDDNYSKFFEKQEIVPAQIRQRLREKVDSEVFEQKSYNSLQEQGPLDFSNLKAFGGSDGMPVTFGALNDSINMVDRT